MNKEWVLTKESFDGLLDWLDAGSRERAGERYESIRRRLIKIFTCRGCVEADQLTDETINRVVRKLPEIAPTYEGDPSLYFYGVAQKVHLEYLRRKSTQELSPDYAAPPPSRPDEREPEYECLDRCMAALPSDQRELVLQYYQDERKAKIDHRKQLAEQLGIALNALRIRAYRIRLTLQKCVEGCLQERLAG